jgi:two-component system, chemotaxis family, sensor kinase CheA
MSTPDQPPFGDAFMDDYFAEADEHLLTIRRDLLALESALGSELPAAVLEELFRSAHSLKGISAMVELHEAERLAHGMESCLRAIRQGQTGLESTNFEALVDATKALEQVVQARRRREPMPAIDRALSRLEVCSQGPSATSLALDASAESRTEPRSQLWRVTFTPSADLIARGVKVDTIRGRLLDIGQILRVAPKVVAGGGVTFEFDVSTDREPAFDGWRGDGVTYERLVGGSDAPTPLEIDGGSQPPPGPTSAEQPPELAFTSTTNFVRVDLARLDDLMRLVGDMVVTRARLEDTLDRIERHVPFQEWRALQEHSSRLERHLRELREGVMRVRLVPVGEIFRRMPFVVRDLARDTDKRVHLTLAGQTTEIDKFLIERMMDPVLHLVRNAISHGIESPEQRIAAGKPPEATIRLGASTAGESVILEIGDDGSGIDVDAVAERAREAGMPVPDGALDVRALLDIICASGFSTKHEADRASGRGVGMAVVRSTVEALGGSLALETTRGQGTTFTITLPLTLAITDAIIAHVGDQVFAIPQSAVREVIEVEPDALRAIADDELLPYRGRTLPMVRLSRLFSIEARTRARLHAVVVGSGLAAVGLVVDRIAGQREIVVKAVTDPLVRVEGVSGATELGDGRLVLILDVAAVSRTLRARGTGEGVAV